MAEYVYPAIFHSNDDGTFTITYPDLPGCISEGKSLGNLADIKITQNEFINLIRADIKDTRAVKRTVSLPKWMDDMVIEAGLSLSRVLQDALKDRLKVR